MTYSTPIYGLNTDHDLARAGHIPSRIRWALLCFWWGPERWDGLRFRAWGRAAALLRRAWYRGRRVQCCCSGCTQSIPAWWASGICGYCAAEDCQHDDNPVPEDDEQPNDGQGQL